MPRVSSWDKFKLLLWKNWILQWNHKWQTVIELGLPAIFTLLLVWIRMLVAVEPMGVTHFFPMEIDSLYLFNESVTPEYRAKFPQFKLLYSPENDYLGRIVKSAAESLDLTYGYQGYPNASALEFALSTGNFLAGVQFDDSWSTITDYPRKFAYALRFPSESRTGRKSLQWNWMTTNLFPLFEMPGPRNRDMLDGGIPVGYLREGFLPLQNALSMSYMSLASGGQAVPEVTLQRYPYPEYIYDPLLEGMASIIVFIILLCFIYPCTSITKFITSEKEKQLKEVMKIMGLNNWIHWMAWFVKSFIMLAISAAFITILLKIKWADDVAVLTYAGWSVLFFFMLIYVLASVCFCFMMAVFFSRASTAASVTGLVWFITYFPFTFADSNSSDISVAARLGWSLFSNTAMGFGFKVILEFEGTGEGVQWSNMFTPVSVDDSITLGYVVIMMLASCVLYMTICLYVEQVCPGEFGMARKWNFPFTRKFWCNGNEYAGVEDMPDEKMKHRNPDAFETEPSGKRIGIQVRNLKKRFGTKMAVNGLSMNMYEDEITVLLGHNGAGKTTTISMLTGMCPPTAGTAIINGSDIRTNIAGARMSLGICPQHNVLFDDMSCANHLIFFSRLKGLRGEAVQREVDKYLKLLQLEDKANVASSKLSGGMKRKLSVCCALCGDTKVVLCDEPSSGMDPSARRQLWDLLQAEKVGRTVLLTTHFMDEADILGDRIAIMCDADLKCHGTSFFLKKKYGSGYHLICVKREHCDVAAVTRLLNEYIPGMRPERDIGTELSYQLPESYAAQFEEMFSALEDQSDDLMLDGYGVGISSMEEVFMKFGAEDAGGGSPGDHTAIMNGGSGFPDADAESVQSDRMFSENTRLLKGTDLCLNQWHAMLLKKWMYTLRSKMIFFTQNLMPICFVVLTIIISRTQGSFRPLPPMTINLTQYPSAVTVLESGADLAPGSLEANIAEQYKQLGTSYGPNYELKSTGAASFEDYILKLGSSIQVRINARYLAAATVANGKLIAWLNNQPLHTAPLTVNLLHNAMARVIVGMDAEISVTNAPLPYTTETVITQLNTAQSLGASLALNLCFVMCFVTSLYILFMIKERVSRAKLLQFVGGVHVWTFWLTQLLWDLVTYTFTALIVVITLACFQEVGLATFPELARVFLLLILFGFSVLPFTYLISFFFTEPATGFSRISTINIFMGVALFIVVLVLSIDIFHTKATADMLQLIFRVFPHFALAMGLHKLYINEALRNACSSSIIAILPDALRCQLVPHCCAATPYFAWEEPGILPEVLYMSIAAVVFFGIIIIREYRLVNEIIYKLRSCITKPPPPPEDELADDDVQREKQRILDMSDDMKAGQNLVLDRVTKYYGDFLAVNQMSLCVKETDCFGLLGVNGAGKTTTFQMMTGDERISSGSAHIKGNNLTTHMNKVYKEIGYCPQFDGLLDDLTGRETLKIFCLLRGIRKDRINQLTEELGKSFGFMKHMDKPTKVYSGGNKRKLSTAIAVIGTPSLIFLDEPTSGMDPMARRQLWNMVCRIRDSGKSIVLTSHSMEECEALCTRLAIMVNGELKCIGSTQHLKNKFSKGLILKIQVKRNPELLKRASKISLNRNDDERSVPSQLIDQDIQNVKDFVDHEFPDAILQEEYQGILTFYIPLSSIKWSKIFGLMERNRYRLNVDDYSISQTTLEEIFLEFAKFQREDSRAVKKKNKYCYSCY